MFEYRPQTTTQILYKKGRPDFHFNLTPLDVDNETNFVEQVKRELRKLTST